MVNRLLDDWLTPRTDLYMPFRPFVIHWFLQVMNLIHDSLPLHYHVWEYPLLANDGYD
jgi:hypothetical protein